ncbi:unnamed protein product [Sphagnum balticum]
MVGSANFEAETAANRASIFEHAINFLARNLSARDCYAEQQLFKLFQGISISARSVAVLRRKRATTGSFEAAAFVSRTLKGRRSVSMKRFFLFAGVNCGSGK